MVILNVAKSQCRGASRSRAAERKKKRCTSRVPVCVQNVLQGGNLTVSSQKTQLSRDSAKELATTQSNIELHPRIEAEAHPEPWQTQDRGATGMSREGSDLPPRRWPPQDGLSLHVRSVLGISALWLCVLPPQFKSRWAGFVFPGRFREVCTLLLPFFTHFCVPILSPTTSCLCHALQKLEHVGFVDDAVPSAWRSRKGLSFPVSCWKCLSSWWSRQCDLCFRGRFFFFQDTHSLFVGQRTKILRYAQVLC